MLVLASPENSFLISVDLVRVPQTIIQPTYHLRNDHKSSSTYKLNKKHSYSLPMKKLQVLALLDLD